MIQDEPSPLDQVPEQIPETGVKDRIKELIAIGRTLFDDLNMKLEGIVPQIPERFGLLDQARLAMAEDLGMLPEFWDDENPEKRMEGALRMMAAWRDGPFRTVNPSLLHEGEADKADRQKFNHPDQVMVSDLISQSS